MADEDYEIIAHTDIEKLKQEIKELREGKTSGSGSNIIQRLDAMLEMFRQASMSMKEETPVAEKLEDLQQKVETILDQNQKIAEGILAIADLINNNGTSKGTEQADSQDFSSQDMPELPDIDESSNQGADLGMQSMQTMPPPMPPPLSPPMPSMRNPSPSKNSMQGLPPMPPRSGRMDMGPRYQTQSFNPMNMPPSHPLGGLPPLPPRPKKKGLFR